MAVLHLFYTLESKEKTLGGYMKSTGDRLGKWEKGKWEKAKWGNLWDWIKSKMG